MSIRVICPEGHSVTVHANKLGGTAFCPHCFASFLAEMAGSPALQARKEDRKSKRSRDEDEDDDDEEDEDEEEEEEKPRKKKPSKKAPSKSRRDEEEDDEDEDDDEEDEGEEEEEGEPKVLNKRQRMLKMVNLGLAFMLASVIGVCLNVFVSRVINAMIGSVGPRDFEQEARIEDLIVLGLQIAQDAIRFGIHLLMVIGMGIGLLGPKRAETRGTIYGGLVFGVLIVIFGITAYLGNVVMSDIYRARNFDNLFLTCRTLCELIFFLLTMVYLKQLASYLKDPSLASKPIVLLMEFAAWYGGPALGWLILEKSIDLHSKIDMLTAIIIIALALFTFGATIRCIFLLYHWIMILIRLRMLVNKAIEDE